MRRALLMMLFVLPAVAFAQDEDEAIPYPDDEETQDDRRPLPRRSEETYTPREETEEELDEREEPLAGVDDPNLGLAGEFVGGLLFADASSGAFPTPRFAWGLRFTWEAGRTLGAEQLKESLFADLNWLYGANRTGTPLVFGDTHLHYFTIAPAYAFPLFGPNKMFALFLQGGAGVAYHATSITIDDVRTELNGIKPVFQYGLGLRGAPTVNEELPLRISFRLELTRFRRGYNDDTFAGGSVGVDF